MSYVDSQISTGVDQLINLVYKEKRVPVERAARELGLAQKVIEEWSRILEEEGIIRIEYQLTTSYLVWIGERIQEPEGLGDLRQQRDSLLTEVEGLANRISGLHDDTQKSEKRLSQLMKEMSAVSAGISKAVDALEETKKEGKVASQEAQEMIAQLEQTISSVKSKMSEYEQSLRQASKSVEGDVKAASALVEQCKSLYDDVQRQLRTVEAQKKRIDVIYSDLQRAEADLRTRIEQYTQLKEGTVAAGLGSAREEFESIKQMYTSLDDTLQKRLEEMRLALKTLDEFSKEMGSLEEKISEDVVAQRYSEIKKIMESLSEISDEEMRIDKKLKLLTNELRSLRIEVPPTASKEVAEKVEEAKSRIKETKREVTMLEQKRKELLDLMGRMKQQGKKG
ncbi:MAG: hypothetical protein N3H30_01480 [Candidatus Micrarchaeota archaeon]|nr:hypothetical protein [Candidatus Micrarchaeota archaeon]